MEVAVGEVEAVVEQAAEALAPAVAEREHARVAPERAQARHPEEPVVLVPVRAARRAREIALMEGAPMLLMATQLRGREVNQPLEQVVMAEDLARPMVLRTVRQLRAAKAGLVLVVRWLAAAPRHEDSGQERETLGQVRMAQRIRLAA